MTGTILMALMGLVILTFFVWYGFFVIALPSAAAISFFRDMVVQHSGAATFKPQLGLTMADGGDSIHKEQQ
jgi:hypothetical protein